MTDTTIKARHIPVAIQGMLAFAADHDALDLARQGLLELAAPTCQVDPRDGTRSSWVLTFTAEMCRRFRRKSYGQIPAAVRELHETLCAVSGAVAFAFETTDDEGLPVMPSRATVEAAVKAAAARAVRAVA